MTVIFHVESQKMSFGNACIFTDTFRRVGAEWHGKSIVVHGADNIEEMERMLNALNLEYTAKEV